MKCPDCDGSGEISKGWMSEPCSYCGGIGELPDDFAKITELKKCKKCGGEAVFSGVFDDPTTYRFPECMKCGARAEGNSTADSWAERARKWNEQNTSTNEEWFDGLSTKEKAKFFHNIVIRTMHATWDGKKPDYPAYLYDWEEWLHEKHKENED